MLDLVDEIFSFGLVIFLILSTIFSLVFTTKLSQKIPDKTRLWLMYPLYFGFTYVIVSLTHATLGIVMLTYVPALVAIIFDDFIVAVVVSLVKPVITLAFLYLVYPHEIHNLMMSFEISWLTLAAVMMLFKQWGQHAWTYYVAAVVLALLEDELGLVGPTFSVGIALLTIGSYIAVVSFMLYLKNHLASDEEAYLAKLNKDPLTGLFNMRAFQEDLNTVKQTVDRDEYILLIMDLDKFKELNDTLGHAVGNEVLQYVANKTNELLAMNFPEIDFKVYRFGGEELICVIKSRGNICRLGAQTAHLFNELNEELMQYTADTYDLKMTFSGGVSSNVWNDFDHDETFKHADNLLYQAKRAGGQQIILDDKAISCAECGRYEAGVVAK